ncbi:MAG: T9SS type A sorting domain-containing protein [Flavobacteriales bacterium]|nr:T9SS type A sorting domain-containing protein [Flavobacteriales bacterium]MCB9363580.1 T9SS type A sorting domain-containing protein [Flavobacteriales bacterium]
MTKNYFFTFLALFILSFSTSATTYTSAQNGNWMDFMTWSPFGVPLPGDIVVIDHAVIMDTSFAYSTGSITVNSGGSLINDSFGRDLWLNGASAQFQSTGVVTLRSILVSSGAFTNSGTLNVKRVANYSTFINNNSMLGVDSMYNDGEFYNHWSLRIMTFFNNNTMNNYGTIQGLINVVDSMWNEGTFINDIGAILKADSATNNGVFTNDGAIEYFQFTNYVNGVFTNNNSLSFDDITNLGDFTNNGNMIGAHSMWNVEDFDNSSTGQITLTTSFLNADSLANTAVFNNDGSFDIGDSFYNFNDITGGSTGSFTMQDTSYNSGTMAGSFEFCDATPASSSPYVDINLGTIDPLITYCTNVGVNENKLLGFTIYPNPTYGLTNIGRTNQYIEVYNIEGKKIIDEYNNQINLENYQSGIYYIVVKDKSGNPLFKEKVVKN